MKRRDFITLVGGSALGWPLAARAQQPAMPVIGFLHSASPGPFTHIVAAFRQGLTEAGFVEGRNVAIEYRWAEGQYDRLPAQAAEFVSSQVAVILAASLPATIPAAAATKTIPIVFVMGADAVKLGVVASLNRPGGNVTGVSQFYGALGEKRLELLRELVTKPSLIAILVNAKNPNTGDHLNNLHAAARAMGQQIDVFNASTESEIDTAFANLVRQGAGALLVSDDPLFTARREQFVALAARYAVPANYYTREFAAAGGLISYGSSSSDNFRQSGVYVGRILKGAKPADLPVLQPTKFELVINLRTAKTLGLNVPPMLLARADEVIE